MAWPAPQPSWRSSVGGVAARSKAGRPPTSPRLDATPTRSRPRAPRRPERGAAAGPLPRRRPGALFAQEGDVGAGVRRGRLAVPALPGPGDRDLRGPAALGRGGGAPAPASAGPPRSRVHVAGGPDPGDRRGAPLRDPGRPDADRGPAVGQRGPAL